MDPKSNVCDVENIEEDAAAADLDVEPAALPLPNDDECTQDHCPICLFDYNEGDLISWSRNKRCQHYFHRDCLLVWLMKHAECPFCRRQYLIDDADVSIEADSDVEAAGPPSAPDAGPVDATHSAIPMSAGS